MSAMVVVSGLVVLLIINLFLIEIWPPFPNRKCRKHGPFRFPPGCAGCQRYFYEEVAKGRNGWEVILEDIESNAKSAKEFCENL